jgi:hypothetical protein
MTQLQMLMYLFFVRSVGVFLDKFLILKLLVHIEWNMETNARKNAEQQDN